MIDIRPSKPYAPLYVPSNHRIVANTGRNSGKSFEVAYLAALWIAKYPNHDVMYCRANSNSIGDSIYNEIREKLEMLGIPYKGTTSPYHIKTAYAVDNATMRGVILQGGRSFDFVTPLLQADASNTLDLGRTFKRAVFEEEHNTAHALTIKVDDTTYAYIAIFGNTSATSQAPQNIGCNIAMLEGVADRLVYGDGWETQTASRTASLAAPEQGARKIVFWGDGKTDVWDTTDGNLAEISHTYADKMEYTIRIFTECVVANDRAVAPDRVFAFYASADAMTATLYTSDYSEASGGFWRRKCRICWGDGCEEIYDTTAATVHEPPTGISHTYAETGEYSISVYELDNPVWVSV